MIWTAAVLLRTLDEHDLALFLSCQPGKLSGWRTWIRGGVVSEGRPRHMTGLPSNSALAAHLILPGHVCRHM